MRYLGVDYGERRTGLALSDPEGRVAYTLKVLTHWSPSDQLAEVLREARSSGSAAVVVGRPLSLAGEEGPAARKVQRFAGRLSSQGVRVVLLDERLTTRQAKNALQTAGVGERAQRSVVDQVAATLILQSYLDHLNASPA